MDGLNWPADRTDSEGSFFLECQRRRLHLPRLDEVPVPNRPIQLHLSDSVNELKALGTAGGWSLAHKPTTPASTCRSGLQHLRPLLQPVLH